MPTDTSDQDDATRAALAGQIWEEEKVYAGYALIFGWLLKVTSVALAPGRKLTISFTLF
jgi:hypothetical protein